MNAHDFPDPELGKAIPYGIYDPVSNTGWVSVGIDDDTSEFIVASIRQWWYQMDRTAYPDATELFITPDGGGSNGYRPHGFKLALQKFADETGLTVRISHFPPGTSKWNRIEHRMFSATSLNWRGRPLLDHANGRPINWTYAYQNVPKNSGGVEHQRLSDRRKGR